MGFNNHCSNYDIGGIQIQNVDEEKDWGVIISKDLKWEKQCSAAVRTHIHQNAWND